MGDGFIHVDSSGCDGCMACVQVCARGALQRRSVPLRPRSVGGNLKPSDVPKVVVGSRAEAKALRAAAHSAEKNRAAVAKSTEKTRTRAVTASRVLESTPGAARWDLTDAVAGVALLLVLVFAKETVLGSRAVSLMPAAGQIATRAVVLGLFYALLAAGLGYLAYRHGKSLLEAFGLTGTSLSATRVAGTAVLVAGMLVLTLVVSLMWGALAKAAGWAPDGSAQLTEVFGVGGLGLVLSIVAVVFVGPFVEELLFRGLVLRVALERADFWPAIVGSAVLFAFSHASARTLISTLALGVAAGWLAARRGSLWAAVALHALYNGLIVALAYFGTP